MNRNGNLIKLLVAIFICFFAEKSFAGGWTQKAGQGLYIQNFSFYYTKNYFDDSSKKKPLNGYYSQVELNPYLEYGVNNWLTVGTNLFLQRVTQDNHSLSSAQTNYGVGDSEFFSRFRIWKNEQFSFALEPMVKLPSFVNKNSSPKIGSETYDTGLTLSGGYSFKAYGQNHFADLDLGYRHRFGAPNDQLKLSGTLGISLTKKWVVMSQIFLTARTKSTTSPAFTQASGDDYNLTKLQLSAVYKISDKLALQAGAFSNVAGRNVGDGDGVIFSIQKNF